jgi:hypothetical protein
MRGEVNMYFSWYRKSNRKKNNRNFSQLTSFNGGQAMECTFEVDGWTYIASYYPRNDFLEIEDSDKEHRWSLDMDFNTDLNDADELVNSWVQDESTFRQDY